jgi:hypothetical protein
MSSMNFLAHPAQVMRLLRCHETRETRGVTGWHRGSVCAAAHSGAAKIAVVLSHKDNIYIIINSNMYGNRRGALGKADNLMHDDSSTHPHLIRIRSLYAPKRGIAQHPAHVCMAKQSIAIREGLLTPISAEVDIKIRRR